MVGEPKDPGMMLLSLVDIFDNITELKADYDFEVTCSYLEAGPGHLWAFILHTSCKIPPFVLLSST